VPTYYPSFLPTPETSSQYGKRDEIMSYFKRVAKEQIGEHKFLWGVSVASAKFDGSWWALSDASGTTTLRCRFLMPAIYSISCKWPHLPAIPNRDLFAGDVQHSMHLGPQAGFCSSPSTLPPAASLTAASLTAAAASPLATALTAAALTAASPATRSSASAASTSPSSDAVRLLFPSWCILELPLV